MQALGLPAPRTQNMRNINIFSGFKTDVHTIGGEWRIGRSEPGEDDMCLIQSGDRNISTL